ncbi:hypothetical protein LguiB_027239 [Lonicera macranthoides]
MPDRYAKSSYRSAGQFSAMIPSKRIQGGLLDQTFHSSTWTARFITIANSTTWVVEEQFSSRDSLDPEQLISKDPRLLSMSLLTEEWLRDLVLQLTRRTLHTSHIDTLERATPRDTLAR